MFEEVFFAIVYGIMGSVHDKIYRCLTAIVIAIVLIIVIGTLAY